MTKDLFVLLIFIASMLVTGCAQNKDYVVTIKTRYGDMVAILYDETPKHKENFVKLAKEKFFDSLLFHRVIQGFMIQGGDPNSRGATTGESLGSGGPGYTIDAEFRNHLFHGKGALSAARLGDNQNPTKASSGSQFYIVQGKTFKKEEIEIDQNRLNRAMEKFFKDPKNNGSLDTLRTLYQTDPQGYEDYVIKLIPQIEAQVGMSTKRDVSPEVIETYSTIGGAPHLDGQYTVFGQVIQGLDVIDKIAAQPVGAGDRPVENIRMTVTVEEMPKKKITKLYGYEFPAEKK